MYTKPVSGHCRHDPECHATSVGCCPRCMRNRNGKGVLVRDHVVRGQHQHQRLLSVLGDGLMSGYSDRGGSVSADRLENDCAGLVSQVANLFCDHEAVVFIADHDRAVVGRYEGGSYRCLLE